MAKKKNEVSKKDVNREDVPEEEFVPEQVDEGVLRDEKKENPMDLVEKSLQSPKKRFKGNWKRVTQEELVKFEEEGRLKGYDPETGEALLK